MKKLTFLPIVLWAATGCGSKIIDRLDCANYQLDQINCQLVEANKKLDTANKNLVEGNKIAKENGGKLDEGNKIATANGTKIDAVGSAVGALEKTTDKHLKDANASLADLAKSVGAIEKTTADSNTLIKKGNEITQKGFDELIKRSPPPKP